MVVAADALRRSPHLLWLGTACNQRNATVMLIISPCTSERGIRPRTGGLEDHIVDGTQNKEM